MHTRIHSVACLSRIHSVPQQELTIMSSLTQYNSSPTSKIQTAILVHMEVLNCKNVTNNYMGGIKCYKLATFPSIDTSVFPKIVCLSFS